MSGAFSLPLEAASNVSISNPQNTEVLAYDSSSGTWKNSTAPGGGSGAPVDAAYLTTSKNSTLTNESVLTAGDGVTITTASGTTTVSANVSAGSGITQSTSKGTITTALDIHGLTAATSLNLTDELPIYDGSVNKKTTVQDIVDLAAAGTTTPTVTIETITEGVAGTAGSDAVNEQQIVEFQGARSAISGTVAFTFGGQSTSGLSASSLTASYLETALATLSSISGSDKIDCTDGGGDSPRDITVEFVGSMAGASQSLITVAPTLTSSALKISVVETTAGVAGAGTPQVIECWTFDETDSITSTLGEVHAVSLDSTGGSIATNSGASGQDLIWTSGSGLSTSSSSNLAPSGNGVSMSVWIKPTSNANGVTVTYRNAAVLAGFRIAQFSGASVPYAQCALLLYDSSSHQQTVDVDLTLNAWNLVIIRKTSTHIGVSINGGAFSDQAISISGTFVQFTPVVAIDGPTMSSDELDELTIWDEAINNARAAALWAGDYYPFNSGGGGTSEVQTLTMTGSPSWGTFTLSYGGETTSNISYNANAATVQAALRALTGLSAVTCSGTLSGGMTVTFPSALGDVALLTVDYSRLLVRVRRVQSGAASIPSVPGTNEVQRVTISDAASGTFTLDFNGTTIGPIDWNADSTAMQTAFDDAGVTVTVTGSNPFDVEFGDSLAETNVAEMTYDASELQGESAADVWQRDSSRAGTLSGDVDGTNAVFTLRKAPSSRCVPMVFVGHLAPEEGYEFVRSGATITFQAGSVPAAGLPVWVIYF